MTITVIRERADTLLGGERSIYHLMSGPRTSDWVDIHCGGGIVMPGHPQEVERGDVCQPCMAAKGRRKP